MQTLSSSDQLAQGIQALRAGDAVRARTLLIALVERDPGNLQAWLWLSGALPDPNDQYYCLARAREIDPQNAAALQGLALLEPHTGAAYTPDWSSAGQATTKLTATIESLVPPTPPAPASLPDPAAPLPPANNIAGLLNDTDAVELVLQEIGVARQNDDVVRQIAQFRQLSWQDAQEFVQLVRQTHHKRIQATHWRTRLMFGGLGLLGLLIVAAAMVVAHQHNLTAVGDPSTPRVPHGRDISVLIFGILFTGRLLLDIKPTRSRSYWSSQRPRHNIARDLQILIGLAFLLGGIYRVFLAP